MFLPNFKVFLVRFLYICVSYHCDKQAKLWIQIHTVSISKDESAFVFLACHQNNVDLLSSNRKHWQIDSIELIKAAPRPRLCKAWKQNKSWHNWNNTSHSCMCCFIAWDTFVYPAKSSEIHLVWAVEHHHVLAEAATHVFGSFSLPSASWPCRSSSHTHAQSLGQCDITPDKRR